MLFYLWKSDQDGTTTAAHTKTTIKDIYDAKFMIHILIIIQENIYFCAGQYLCFTALLIIYCLLYSYNVIILCAVSDTDNKKMFYMVSILIKIFLIDIMKKI